MELEVDLNLLFDSVRRQNEVVFEMMQSHSDARTWSPVMGKFNRFMGDSNPSDLQLAEV